MIVPAVYRAKRQEEPSNYDVERNTLTMKRMMIFGLCAILVLSLAACGAAASTKEIEQIPNPYVDCACLEDAARLAGFEMTVPETVCEYRQTAIQAIEKDMIQVFYGESEEECARIRKGVGTDDISGDYNTYTQENTAAVGDLKVTMKGSDSQVSLAVWTNSGYTYSVSVKNPISVEAMSVLIAGIR